MVDCCIFYLDKSGFAVLDAGFDVYFLAGNIRPGRLKPQVHDKTSVILNMASF